MDKETMKMFSEILDSKLEGLENRLDDKFNKNTMLLEHLTTQVNKNTLELETINSKLNIVAEVQQNIMVQTEKQIQEVIEPFCEDVSVIKSAVKHISNEVADVSEKIEYIGMKEFNNERDLFMMKKKLSQ